MEMTRQYKRKKEFKDTRLAGFIRNRIYAHRRYKRRYREVIGIAKEIAVLMMYIFVILVFFGILGLSLYWFVFVR